MTRLAQELQAKSAQLGKRVLDQMYLNPFWEERFGERGRRKADEDSNYHVSYLVQSLLASDPRIFTRYARWLQSVLVSRGMCTRHIVENFVLLEQAIRDDVADADAAVALLHAGREALRYDEGPARALQEHAPTLLTSAQHTLFEKQPSWQARFGDDARSQFDEDLAHHIDYLADAIATCRADLFARYVSWVGAFLGRRGVPIEQLQQTLHWLAEQLTHDDSLPAALREQARDALLLAIQRASHPELTHPPAQAARDSESP